MEKSPLNNFLGWLVEPIVDIFSEEKNNPIIEITNTIPQYVSYRPSTFAEYIGQERAKLILDAYIKATKKRGITLPHILIHGKPGCGKTTLAQIISNEAQIKFNELITSTLKNPAEFLTAIQQSDGGILFLDEIHSIDRNCAESMYSIMEDFKYSGIPVKPFTLIGATTEIGELIKDRKPFIDRFKIIIELQDYTVEELTKLIRQYRNTTFPLDNNIQLDSFKAIAENCRATPRTAIRLLEALIYLENDLSVVLHNFDIIKEGYTSKDLKILKYISLNDKGIGLQGLVSYLETSEDNYLKFIEPYLLKNELILRTARGRKITEKGISKIKELELYLTKGV